MGPDPEPFIISVRFTHPTLLIQVFTGIIGQHPKQGINMIEKNDLENNLNRIHEWIRSADQKVSIFLAFQGVVLTILMPDVFRWTVQNFLNFSPLHILLILSATVLLAYSIFNTISALMPRLKKKIKQTSLIYFGDIANFQLPEYQKALNGLTNETYSSELISQIYISAKIATTKHKQFQDSIILFIIGLIFLFAVYLIFTAPVIYGY